MFFNSLDFAVFLPIVFGLYWFVTQKSLRVQNLLIVVASYFFYGVWDWRFLSLILFSTILDFVIGKGLQHQENNSKRKLLLMASIAVNLGFLGFFKYSNFFLDSFNLSFSFFGKPISAESLKIVLPVGISFYTFQTLSYTVDVYRRKLEPTKDFIAFAAFVSFFPQLVAGPIERATNLLPQFNIKRHFDRSKAVDGVRQILWGLFKKIVIADNCAEYANIIFNNSDQYSGATLGLGAIFFAFQIYGDFSGYSDIAIGTSRLFGFNLKRNFAFPYFSRDIAEFWRKWHISLSTWFRDYVYIPLGGSKVSKGRIILNTFIIFVVSGFWHGANWTFIVWGALNAIFFLPLLIGKRNRNHLDNVATGKLFPSFKELIYMIGTFSLTTFSWIFFRAKKMDQALQYCSDLFTGLFTEKGYEQLGNFWSDKMDLELPILLLLFIAIEWLGREKEYAIEKALTNKQPLFRYAFYYAIVFAIIWFGGHEQDFIYFQF